MEALVRLTNALVSLANDNSALREESRQLRQALQENQIAPSRIEEVPVHPEGERGCCKGSESCQGHPYEEGEEVDG